MISTARSAVLVALYLRGLPGVSGGPVREWPMVLDALRRGGIEEPPASRPDAYAELLASSGLWQAAASLRVGYRWQAAVDLLAQGKAFSADDARYPARWRSRAGASPPALWRRPGRYDPEVPLATVVGSRRLDRAAQAFARRSGEVIADSGLALLSGGAVGADRLAMRGALDHGGRGVELLACGFHHAPRSSAEQWSLVAPGEEFSTALAMERNLLLYSGSARSLVVHARFRAGGSWHGAVAALRGRVSSVLVREAPPGEPDADFVAAQRALVALGARPLAHPDEFLSAELRDPQQPALAWGA